MAEFIQSTYFGPALNDPRQIVIHSVESEIKRLSRSLARGWFRNPSNKTSAHTIADPEVEVQCVPYSQQAWHCGRGNPTSIGKEHAGRASFTRAQWTTPDGMAMLRNSAREAAEICRQFDIPARWLSLVQVAKNEKGFCTHNDMRLARGGTTHTDPGPNFPYDTYMQLVVEYLDGSKPVTPTPKPREDDMFIIANTTKNLPWRLIKQSSAPQITGPESSALQKCGVKVYKITDAEFNAVLAAVGKK